jgi:thiol-disulfide isomerase/thioredoxin
VLVHFWATWCPICRLEQDSIASIAADWPAITIATTSGSAEELSDYLREDGLTMPVLLDEHGEIARRWGVQGVPATFIVDGDNIIRHAGMGFATEIGLRLRLWLTRLVHEGGPA